MTELFDTFSTFKSYVGGRVNNSMNIDSLAPTIWETARRHVVPMLSQSQYDALVTAVATNTFTSAQTALLPFVRRALAVLTMYEYSKVAAIEVSDSGIHRTETDTRKAAYRYQEKQYQEDAREKGYDSLELMLRFLADNSSTYSAWAATDEAKRHREPLLNYASTFRMQCDLKCDRYTFEALRPIISSVQMLGVEALLPKSFWTGFITRHVGGTLTNAEKELRLLIQRAIAHKALEEAQAQHWVHVNAGRVFIVEEFGEQNQYNKTSPTAALATLSQRQALWSDRYTCAWKQYILDNPDDFATVFDEASGGSSTSANAWHINTVAEQEKADADTVDKLGGPVYIL